MIAVLLAMVALHLPGELRKPAVIVGSTAIDTAVDTGTSGPLVDATPVATPWPPLDDDVSMRLGLAIDDALANRRLTSVAGLGIGVLHRGHAWRQGRGHARPDTVPPSTSTTSWRVASITKTMTAVAVMQLVDAGRLNLDDTVGALLPGAPRTWRAITLRQLLAHTSGIRHYPLRGPEQRLTTHLTTTQSLALFSRRPLAHPPGQSFLYTTYGYDVLGAILEAVTGHAFADVLAEQLFGPLGLQSTVVEDSRHRAPSWPEGVRFTAGGRLQPSARVDVSSRFAGGGVRSTIDDLLRFGDALLANHLVDADTFRSMTAPSMSDDGLVNDYGLGFAVYPQRGHLVVAHAGGQPETTSLLFLIPAEHLVIALATNLEDQGDTLSAVAQAIVEVVAEDGFPRRAVWSDSSAGADSVIIDGLNRAFTHGRAFVDLVVDDVSTDAAFARFEALVDPAAINLAPVDARARITSAHHPMNGRVTPIVGAAIARALRDVDNNAFATLPRRGPLAFFADWVALCERDAVRCPPARRPTPSLSATVRRLQAAWEHTPPAVHRLRVRDLLHVPETTSALTPLVGSPVHPDLSDDLMATSHLLLASRPADAITIARLNTALHPDKAQAQLALAEALLMMADDDESAAALEQAWRLGGPDALPAKVWLARVGRLRVLPTPRAEAAATTVLNFARLRLPDDKTLRDTDDEQN